MTAGDLLVGLGTTLLAAFTALLAHRTRQDLSLGQEQIAVSRESIQAQETQRRRARQEDVAVAFDHLIAKLARETPKDEMALMDARDGIDGAISTLDQEWELVSVFLVGEESLSGAYSSLRKILGIAKEDCEIDPKRIESFYAVGAAFAAIEQT